MTAWRCASTWTWMMRDTARFMEGANARMKEDSIGPSSKKALKSREERENEAILAMRQVMGARSDDAAGRLTIQACHALVWPPVDNAAAIVEAVAAMAELSPANGTEGMLAVQMIAAHNAALLFLNRATIKEQRPEAIDSNVIRAARLMRVFVEQVDAMQRLKGKTAQQKVTVEHVHVHEGGQAIVGAVSTTRGGGSSDDGPRTP